jgi:hypothetical protein
MLFADVVTVCASKILEEIQVQRLSLGVIPALGFRRDFVLLLLH